MCRELTAAAILARSCVRMTTCQSCLLLPLSPADWGGGPNRYALICDTVRIVRVTDALAEVAFIDSTNTPLQNEHHVIMTADTSGLYGYNIMKAVAIYGEWEAADGQG